MALDPGQLSPEAVSYEERLQQSFEDTVVERRHFDDRRLHLGVGAGPGSATGVVGLYAELDLVDRLALGAGGGITFWGPAFGGYLRGRPIVWGGQGKRLLNALTLQVGYTRMSYGSAIFEGVLSAACHGDDDEPSDGCYTGFVNTQVANFGLIQAGFEHAIWNGLSIHYELGVLHSLTNLRWSCTHLQQPATCEGISLPVETTWVLSVGVSAGVL